MNGDNKRKRAGADLSAPLNSSRQHDSDGSAGEKRARSRRLVLKSIVTGGAVATTAG